MLRGAIVGVLAHGPDPAKTTHCNRSRCSWQQGGEPSNCLNKNPAFTLGSHQRAREEQRETTRPRITASVIESASSKLTLPPCWTHDKTRNHEIGCAICRSSNEISPQHESTSPTTFRGIRHPPTLTPRALHPQPSTP